MLKQILPIGIVIVGALLGEGVFALLDQNRATVSYAVDIFENLDIPTSEYVCQWEPSFGNGTMSLRRTFLFNDIAIYLYVITYLSSEPDSELIRYGRSLIDSEEWVQGNEPGTSIANASIFGFNLNIVRISKVNGPEELAVMYWYDVGGRPMRSRNLAKFHSITNLFRFREDSSAVVIATPCAHDCDKAAEVVGLFVASTFLGPAGKYRSIVRNVAGQD